MLISQAKDLYLSHCKHIKKLSEHTLRAYRMNLTSFSHFSGECPVADCDRVMLQGYMRHLFDAEKLKESSVKRRFACLKALFDWLEYDDIIQETPFRKFDLKVRLPALLPRSLSENEIHTMLQTALHTLGETQRTNLTPQRCEALVANPKDFRNLTTLICIDLLFATGIRVMELAAISLSDIDFTQQNIRIHGKGDRERLVFLPSDALVKLLSAYVEARKNMGLNNNQLILTACGTAADTQYIRLLRAPLKIAISVFGGYITY